VSFKVAVEGTRLHLSNFSVYPVLEERLGVGTGQMLNAVRQVADMAKSQGFESIRITGVRMSGIDPGHVFDVVIPLIHLTGN
jgi:hypothetical protein